MQDVLPKLTLHQRPCEETPRRMKAGARSAISMDWSKAHISWKNLWFPACFPPVHWINPMTVVVYYWRMPLPGCFPKNWPQHVWELETVCFVSLLSGTTIRCCGEQEFLRTKYWSTPRKTCAHNYDDTHVHTLYKNMNTFIVHACLRPPAFTTMFLVPRIPLFNSYLYRGYWNICQLQ